MSDTNTVSPLRERMIEDMAARKLNPHTQRGHISSCKRFAAWLKRSPDTATPDEVRQFQLYLIESGMSICNRNRIMTGVRFLFRVTLRRHDLAAEVWHIKEPERLPPVLSPEEVKRVLYLPLMADMMTPLADDSVTLNFGGADTRRQRRRVVDSLPPQPPGVCRLRLVATVSREQLRDDSASSNRNFDSVTAGVCVTVKHGLRTAALPRGPVS